MMCALGAAAAEAYLCYMPSNTTMTFYYDNQKSSRPGSTYYIDDYVFLTVFPAWYDDGISANVTRVVFDPSFAGARPERTHNWFCGMENLHR